MRELQLDFQPRAIASALGWLLLLVGGVLAAAVLSTHMLLVKAERIELDKLSAMQLELRGGPVNGAGASRKSRQGSEVSVAEMRRISAEMNLPWNALFNSLESIPRDDIALLSIAPDARKQQLRLTAEARNLEAMLAFHRNLESTLQLRDISLLSHETLEQVPERPVRFSLSATWLVE
ncbi:PilN domain-containing protein [Pseudomonas sp. NPDC078700]|uniref:PilN domain-containing protein n=1 Tax=Pseudomonas sp. NPDC078700 TaxID=3364424 RepID=UPI0037CC810F